MRTILFTTLLVFGFAAQSPADDILFSNLGQPDHGGKSFNNSKVRYATDFLTDGMARTVTSILARMDNTDSDPHVVTFSIFTDDSGTPGTLVSAFDTPAILPAGASGIFTATSAGINLQANTTYWVIGQMIEFNRAPQTVYWRYTESEATDGIPFSTVPGTPILGGNNGETTFAPDTNGNLLFALTAPASVPEPATLALALVTIASACGAYWWRRRQRVALDNLPDPELAN